MMPNTHPRPRSIRLPLLLMLLALVLRVLRQHHVVEALPNLSPLMAFAFAGTVVFPRPLPWWSWALLLLGVDLISEGAAWWAQANGHIEVVAAYACFAAAAFWGSRLRDRAGVTGILGGTLACSMIFYLVTNTVSWMTDPAYAKDAAGWWQALTIGTGIPGIPTTLAFFRNSLAADLVGAAILLVVYNAEAVSRCLPVIPWRLTKPDAAGISAAA